MRTIRALIHATGLALALGPLAPAAGAQDRPRTEETELAGEATRAATEPQDTSPDPARSDLRSETVADLQAGARVLNLLERSRNLTPEERTLAERGRFILERRIQILEDLVTVPPPGGTEPPPGGTEPPPGGTVPPPGGGTPPPPPPPPPPGGPLVIAEPAGTGQVPTAADFPALSPTWSYVTQWGIGLHQVGTGGLTDNRVADSYFGRSSAANQKGAVMIAGSSPNGGRVERIILERSIWEGSPPPAWAPNGARWLVRGWNLNDLVIEGCQFLRWDEEHALYLNAFGNFYIVGNRFEDGGAQALQVAWRRWETTHQGAELDANGDGSRARQVFKENLIKNVGQNRGAGRASYAFSLFHGQNSGSGGNVPSAGDPLVSYVINAEVDIVRNRFESDVDAGNGTAPNARSFGAIYVQARPRVRLEGNVIRHVKPNRAVVQLFHIDDGDPTTADVLMAGGEVLEGIVAFVACGDVDVAPGIAGSATLEVWSVPAGINPWWYRQKGALIHAGPLSAGYQGPGGAL